MNWIGLNVDQLCSTILNHPIPLSLRLRAILLAGLVQIYCYQVAALERTAMSLRDRISHSNRPTSHDLPRQPQSHAGIDLLEDHVGEGGAGGGAGSSWSITLPLADLSSTPNPSSLHPLQSGNMLTIGLMMQPCSHRSPMVTFNSTPSTRTTLLSLAHRTLHPPQPRHPNAIVCRCS
jgi:hypothetical protein